MSSRRGARSYIVAPTAARAAIDAAHRGALIAVRDELDLLCVEVATDHSWPPDLAWAMQALELRQRRGRTLLTRRPKPPEIVADLRPTDDDDFAIAVAVVPYTSYTIGITHDDGVAYSSYHHGYEPYFELTDPEHALAANYIAAHGVDPGLLIPFQESRRDD